MQLNGKCIDVNDWKSFFECCKIHDSVSLDTTDMSIPDNVTKEIYWLKFNTYLKIIKTLKCLILWKCPISAVNAAFTSLPQLEILRATSIQ